MMRATPSSRALVAGALVALMLTGCGAGAAVHGRSGSAGREGFGWLRRGAAPAGWAPVGVLAAGSLPRPPGFEPLRGDAGTVTFEQMRGGTLVGYLNATPQQGEETIAGWARFRVAHNAAEGDRHVRALASVTNVRVGAVRVSCVSDSYATSRATYRELACLVARGRSGTVVLGAAPPRAWARQLPVIRRAIAGFIES